MGRRRTRPKKHSEKFVTPLAAKPITSVRLAALGLVLVSVTVALYSPVRTHAFITYDDYDYIVNNSHVTAGMNWQTVRWAMTSTEEFNWHPVTWLSHALDCQLFGLDPGAHHLMNVAIHALNVLLLFLLLQKVTGAVGRSFVVSALFAWHPLNVQSVAWVAERKNVLSTMFFLVALGAYGWYARNPALKRYLLAATLFLLALASKPMAVSLPFVLLLLDCWPLKRVAGWTGASSEFPCPPQSISRLLLEKLPLFALSAASCVITVWAQRAGGAMQTFEVFSLGPRLGNAFWSYLLYLSKTFWPSGLAVFYPHPGYLLPWWKPALAIAVLCGVSVIVWTQRTSRPFLIVGWLWFVGTLVPMIGIVQVGDQAMADRYAYVPLIGLFVMVVWSVAEFFESHEVAKVARVAVALSVLVVFGFLSFQQLGYWDNTQTLWTRALKVTNGNVEVEKKFGNAMVLLGEPDEAIPHLIYASKADPMDMVIHVNLGMCLLAKGRIQEATEQLEEAVKLTNDQNTKRDRQFRASAFVDLGIAYVLSKDYAKALTNFQGANAEDAERVNDVMRRVEQAVVSAPAESDFLTLSLLLQARGKNAQASSVLEDAIKGDPANADARELLAYLNSKSKMNSE